MPPFLVAHPHKGDDGRRRMPGEVVNISAEEAAVRTRDGSGRVVDPAEAEQLRAAAEESAGSMAARSAASATAPPAGGQDADDTAPRPPKMSAPKHEWLTFLTAGGHDPAELAGKSRGELIELAQADERGRS